ncbi:MAG TPA: V-type ATP synthase subunit C [Methanoregulaceae archaeon]|nr:V-type ATP synthase subunit C [Methanoregulaceae archaeon]HOH80202.1 V-type ATP synthase subunit C [Methanoregulaceae archaeon]HPA08790.1 V-type ATP synthase subunit C [Methanoregulaceae archaeon]HPW10264.1 V-type ATP synthase subunit C [Methanoregulaceae archaeon]
MADISAGPAPYVYVCTRLRVRKAKLIPREDYLRLLNMSIPEITRFIEETQYKREIDELASSFHGIDLIELALSWNLAKEYQSIQDITPGVLKRFTQSYLRKWDIQNILTILRGKTQGMKPGKIREILVPAGEMDRVFLDRLVKEETPERILEALKGQSVYPAIAAGFSTAVSEGSFARIENELYKQFYENLLSEATSGFKGGKQFLEYIMLDIDITNIRNMFRLRADTLHEDARSMMIPGGTFSTDAFQHLISIEESKEFIDTLKSKVHVKPLIMLLEEMSGGEKSLREIEIDLIKVQLAQMESLSKLNPFSIHPILTYLEKKKYEIFNLRAIARGKEVNLPTDRIRSYLVM